MKEIIRNNKKLHLSDQVLKIFESHIQSKMSDLEAGGILLGQLKDDGIYILNASTPNKYDKATRNSFECNKDAAQIIINYEFINSEKRTIYIGEWHTHPEKYPSPSSVDHSMIINQFRKNTLNEDFLILIIQGLEELYVALFDGKKLHIK